MIRPSQRPEKNAWREAATLSNSTVFRPSLNLRDRSATVTSLVEPVCTQMVAPFMSLVWVMPRSLRTMKASYS